MTKLSDIYSNFFLGIDYVKVSDVKSTNTAGGTFTLGAWRTRVINTEDSDASAICSVSSNQITLEAGTYICEIICPGYAVANNKARLYDITNSAVVILGVHGMAHPTYGGFTNNAIRGQFTIAATTVFEIQHWCIATVATQGFGTASNIDSTSEVFTVAEFIRIKDLSQTFNEMADYVKVSDVKAYNAWGGTFTQGAWRTRDINTEDSDASAICAISSNQIILEAGTYICNIKCSYSGVVTSNRSRLYNITGSGVTILGSSETGQTLGDSGKSFISGRFTISVQTTFEVQHYCNTTQTNQGLGYYTNVSGIDSVYTVAEFWRVAT